MNTSAEIHEAIVKALHYHQEESARLQRMLDAIRGQSAPVKTEDAGEGKAAKLLSLLPGKPGIRPMELYEKAHKAGIEVRKPYVFTVLMRASKRALIGKQGNQYYRLESSIAG